MLCIFFSGWNPFFVKKVFGEKTQMILKKKKKKTESKNFSLIVVYLVFMLKVLYKTF
jgi:hypothetical protein